MAEADWLLSYFDDGEARPRQPGLVDVVPHWFGSDGELAEGSSSVE